VKSLFSSAVGQKEINRLQFITEAAQKMLVKELRQPYLGWWFNLSGKIKEHTDLTDEARDILRKLIDERRSSGERQDDLLDMLLEAKYDDGSGMENEQLIDEILILFTAGHETTSNALTFTAQLLARHPQAQEKILEEVKKAKTETNSLAEFIQACTYTKMVIEESMRLYPPVYFIDRVNNENDVFDGLEIPKDSTLLFSMYEIHRHKDFWEDPEEFKPERFTDPKKYSSCYYPFGAGPRMCIGNNFAMYEMVLAIAELVERYEISSSPAPIQIKPLISLKPENSVLEFKKR
jgi:cytochrome P450